MSAPVYPSFATLPAPTFPSINTRRGQQRPPSTVMTMASPHPFPAPFPAPPLFIMPTPNRQTLTNEELNTKPNPHPHLPSLTVHIDHVPPEMKEVDIAKSIPDCTPVSIELWHHVPPNCRIQPNLYYEWMPQMGSLTFQNKHTAEKAMAILASHPLLTPRGVVVSPYPLPSLLPSSSSTGRYVRPLHQTLVPPVQPDPNERMTMHCPSPGELFDAVRQWGSIRELRVWAETPPAGQGESPSPFWGARIDFWFEEEARRFEIGFGQRGGLIKGWQVAIYPEPIMSMPPMAPPPPLMSPQTPSSTGSPTPEQFNFFPGDLPPDPAYPIMAPEFTPMATPPMNMGMGSMSKELPSYLGFLPPLSYTPPWGGHNPYTINGTDMPMPMSMTMPYTPIVSPICLSVTPPYTAFPPLSPVSPGTLGGYHGRGRLSRASMGSLRNNTPTRPRTWSMTVRTGPDGDLQATGLVSSDGTVIQHGPGQHIRPAPATGPGSTSSSGLVDYSNVFVKNLDPDINSQFLSDLFSAVGQIVSARVMRDSLQRSRGYGFVSFHTPEQAAAAVREFHGIQVGSTFICVTLHEPRLVRPEKLAQGYDLARRRMSATWALRPADDTVRSPSPTFGTLQSRHAIKEFHPSAAKDKLRSLSPDRRKHVLAQRVSPLVNHLSKYQPNEVPEDLKKPLADALIREDLALIPLLHDPAALKAKIEDLLSTLRHEKKAGAASLPVKPERETETGKSVTLKDTEAIRFQVALIDPANVDAVMPLIMRGMTWDNAKLCLSSCAALAHRYNDAKKELINKRLIEETSIEPAQVALPVSDSTTTPSLSLDMDTLDFDKLVSRSAREIVDILESDRADEVLKKVGLAQPSMSELSFVADWTRETMMKMGVEKKTEMAGMLLRRLQGDLKKSQKIKVAREVVNMEEDDEALCLLMAWPVLLNAKVRKVTVV